MYLAVGIGGIFGAILRFVIYKWFLSHGSLPFAGTLCVNLLGCFLLGYLQGAARIYTLPNWFVVGFGTGLIGAFTTFSTFSMEVIDYVNQGYRVLPALYIMASSVGGYLLAHYGFTLVVNNKKRDV